MNWISLIVSLFALALSGSNFWLTRLKRGRVKMTRPTIICFLGENGQDEPKIFIRTLLYSTADRGQYVQNMYASLKNSDESINFNFWAYGDNSLVRGSGLFIDKSGISSYHHFLLSKDAKYSFKPGKYLLQVFAETVNKKPEKLYEEQLELNEQESIRIQQNDAVYFDWAPDMQKYRSYIKTLLQK